MDSVLGGVSRNTQLNPAFAFSRSLLLLLLLLRLLFLPLI